MSINITDIPAIFYVVYNTGNMWVKAILVYLSENTTFDNNFVKFGWNVTTFGVLIANIAIGMLHDFGCYGNHFGGESMNIH